MQTRVGRLNWITAEEGVQMLFTGFKDRTDAGRKLALGLKRFAGKPDVVILGLPRGGVPPAFEVAKYLRAPLDVFLVGKLGFPGQPELALGAVTSDGIELLNPDLLEQSGMDLDDVKGIARKKRLELERKEAFYRQGRPSIRIEGQSVILVDDGIATGASMRTALQALRNLNPKRIIAAIPVASVESLQTVRMEADETVCLQSPERFNSVGQWYEDFGQVTDEEVVRYLEMSKERNWNRFGSAISGAAGNPDAPFPLRIHAGGGAALSADLVVPRDSGGLVIFAHGSGSSRLSPRNRHVARFLNEAGFATLLLDLLTQEEEDVDEYNREYRFDVELLAERLMGVVRWAQKDARLSHLGIGFFGASTGSAAALVAAARWPDPIAAIVSRGGRPDLAGDALPDVKAPTLLIVGAEDESVLELNRHAVESMRCVKKLQIIPGATHLFEEPGALEEVSGLAMGWFEKHLLSVSSPATS